MIRLFDPHPERPTVSLDGLWSFTPLPSREADPHVAESQGRPMLTPGVWEQAPDLIDFRGTAAYRRTVRRPDPAGHTRLAFAGVSHTADVYVDGQHMAHHEDAYTPFEAIVPPAPDEAASFELVVHVDNTFGDHAALHVPNDYYTYGGITRPVEAQALPAIHFRHVHLTPRRSGDAWGLDVRAELGGLLDASPDVEVRVSIAGLDAATSATASAQPGASTELAASLAAVASIEDVHPEPWSHASPRLYEVRLEAVDLATGETVDVRIERIGFRTIEVQGDQILLNGEPLRLRGFNRHEDHPSFGCALPVEMMMADLHQMLDMGANCVRTSHYPNDQRFLDLCDELGVYVWEESHARAIPMDHPRFREQIAASTREMVAWHFNHPSIVLWGCLNECASHTPEGKAEYARVLGLLRELDSSRPVTFASCHHRDDLCMDLVDVVSFNIYSGWYAGRPEDAAGAIEELAAWLDSDASGGAGKPMIMSEFGAGAIFGNRDGRRAKWSEEYQAHLLAVVLDCFLNHPRLSGAIIWQFCDCRVDEAWWYGRPRTRNNKGIVDEYRRPKLAYHTVKQAMTGRG